MTTPFLVIGNFKMNQVTRAEAEQYVIVLRREMATVTLSHSRGILCPSFVHLGLYQDLSAGIRLGAQHGFPEKSGAFTGEVSFAQLKDMGVEYVILGHSERRHYFGETDEATRVRLEAALKYLVHPVVCIGETREERQSGKRDALLSKQLETLFRGLPKMQAEKVVVAYEPRWAIGSGEVPTTEEIVSVGTLIRQKLTELFDENTMRRISVVYGGSVKTALLGSVSFEAGMNGVLVGGESLSPYEMVKMLQAAEHFYTD